MTTITYCLLTQPKAKRGTLRQYIFLLNIHIWCHPFKWPAYLFNESISLNLLQEKNYELVHIIYCAILPYTAYMFYLKFM